MTTKTATPKNFIVDLKKGRDGRLNGFIHANRLIEAFPKDRNIRDIEKGYDPKDDSLKDSLIEAGHVQEAVHLAITPQDLTVDEFLKLKDDQMLEHLYGEKGNRRTWFSHEIVNGIQPLGPGWENFDPLIPVVLIAGMSTYEMMQYKLDHSRVKGLNEWEIVLCLIEMNNTGSADTNEDKVWYLKGLFESHMSLAEREKLKDAVSKLPRYADPVVQRNEEKKLTYKMLKGRYQKLQRIAEAKMQWVRDNFRAEVYKDPKAIHITNEDYVKIWNLDNNATQVLDSEGNAILKDGKPLIESNQFATAIKEIVERKRRESEVKKVNAWKTRDAEKKCAGWGSEWVTIIVMSVLGDESAQAKLGPVVQKIRDAEKADKLPLVASN